MARLPAFLDTLADLDGRPVESLQLVARALRVSGHLPPTKRGPASTPIDATAAANLLIATMADVQPSGSPRAVEVYSSLRNKRRGGFGKGFPALEAVAQAETFGEALETLVAVSPKLKAQALVLLAVLFDKVPAESLLSLDFFSLEVTISKPVPHARMVLSAVNEHGLYSHEWSAEWILDSKKFMGGFYQPELAARADKRTETTITHRSIFRLGDVIAADDECQEYQDETSRDEGTPQPEGCGDAGAPQQGRDRKARSYGFGESGLRLPAR